MPIAIHLGNLREMGIAFDGESKGPMTHQTKFAVNFREHSTYHFFFLLRSDSLGELPLISHEMI